jgi:hypothetical protein
MARKAGQIVARGASIWLVRAYLGRDPQTGTRKYHNQTIHGPFCITHDPAKTKTFMFDQHEGLLVLNVYWFYERSSVVANKYLDQLSFATDGAAEPLRTFDETFRKTFRTGFDASRTAQSTRLCYSSDRLKTS